MLLKKQKFDLEDAAQMIKVKIEKLKSDQSILYKAIEAIEKDEEDILNGHSILAGEARSIMREISNGA